MQSSRLTEFITLIRERFEEAARRRSPRARHLGRRAGLRARHRRAVPCADAGHVAGRDPSARAAQDGGEHLARHELARTWFRFAKTLELGFLFCQNTPHSPFVPAEAGTQGQALQRLQVWVPASAGTNGVCCSARVQIFSCRTARCDEVSCREAKENRPLFAALGQGVAVTSSLPSPSKIEGDGAPTRRSARITPGGLSGLRRTVGALSCTRALRRANAASWPLCL